MRFRKVLIAPDKFKGTLSAVQAARAIERGLRAHMPEISARLLPIADGGEGTVQCILAALPRALLACEPALTPCHKTCIAEIARNGDEAFFDMAACSGLQRVPLKRRDPWRLDTHGVGGLLRALACSDGITYMGRNSEGEYEWLPSTHVPIGGPRRIFIGLGGSATNDAGVGMAAALGFRFFDGSGREIKQPCPEKIARIERVLPPADGGLLRGVEVVALCDVTNPLLGPNGASFVYGPQKGLRDPERMDAALARIADVVARDLGVDFRNVPGAGAAGGLGYGLMTFCGAKLQPGFETIAELAGIDAAVRECDLVITGEGRLDAQTLCGKGPAELARLARREGKPAVAFGGCVETGAEQALREVFADICTLTGPGSDGDGAEAALEAAAARFAAAMEHLK